MPYKPNDPDEGKPATQIYVETTLGEVKELSTQSKTVAELRSKYTLLRYYFPEGIRKDVDRIAATTFLKERKK
jgi:hypothetical protein